MISVIFHIEPADGEMVVWAESPEMPGFSAIGSSVPEVRELVIEELARSGSASGQVVERLDGIELDGWKLVLLVDGIEPIEHTGTIWRAPAKAVDPVPEYA